MNSTRTASDAPRIRRQTRYFLIAIWICFLARGAFYASLLPLWEGYDEWAHYGFVQHLAETGKLPDRARDRVSLEVEESFRIAPSPWDPNSVPQVEVAPKITYDAYWNLPPGERSDRERQLLSLPPEWAHQGGHENIAIYEALQPPLYYWISAWILKTFAAAPLVTRVLLLRWWSVAIASALIPLCFLVALRVFRDENLALGVAALVAAMPELQLDVVRVGNECLATVLYSLLIYLVLLCTENARERGLFLAAGATLGLGLLTKAYFLTALPALAVVFAWQLWREKDNRRRMLVNSVMAAAAAVLLSSWWYLRNIRQSGTISGLGEAGMLQARGVSLGERFRHVPDVRWANAFYTIVFSHIWYGAWSGLTVRRWIYDFFLVLILLAAAGLVVLAWRLCNSSVRETHRLIYTNHLLILLTFYGFFWLGQGYNVLLLFLTKGASVSMGWYLYAVIAAEVAVGAAGLLTIAPQRFRGWVLPGAAGCLALLDLYTVQFVLAPYYTGLIAHRPDGGLSSFHLAQLWRIGLHELLSRMQAGKSPLLSSWFIAVLWVAYLTATIALTPLARGKSEWSPPSEEAPDHKGAISTAPA